MRSVGRWGVRRWALGLALIPIISEPRAGPRGLSVGVETVPRALGPQGMAWRDLWHVLLTREAGLGSWRVFRRARVKTPDEEPTTEATADPRYNCIRAGG